MKRSLFSLLVLGGIFFSPAPSQAIVTFDITYEPGSRFFTQPYSDELRTICQEVADEIGALFDNTATIELYFSDDVTSPFVYAQTYPDTFRTVSLAGKPGVYRATGVWFEIMEGTDPNGGTRDGTIEFNLMDPPNLLYGDEAELLEETRDSVRHEMMHLLGMWSDLRDTDSGSRLPADVIDAMVVDDNGDPILSNYAGGTFDVNFEIDPAVSDNDSGIRFQSMRSNGTIDLLEFSATPFSVDFAHVAIISERSERPDGPPNTPEIIAEDENFLRGLGYVLVGDPGAGGGGGGAGGGGGGAGGGGGGINNLLTDPSDQCYALASYYYYYYGFFGDYNLASAYYYFYMGCGDYYANLAGGLASASLSYYNGLAYFYYFYYLSLGDVANGSFFLNYYTGVAIYYYYAYSGDYDTANYYYNLYLNLSFVA